MRVFWSLLFVLFLGFGSTAQGRKMPPFSFKEHSIQFADANRSYSQGAQYTQADTLSDAIILSSLLKILTDNPQLNIELSGHTASNENTELGMERAMLIKKKLVDGGIGEERLTTVNMAHENPLLSDKIILSLPSKIEKDAANEKNRRVEVRVVGKKE